MGLLQHSGKIWTGLNADKPTVGGARRYAYCTDTGKLWYDDGSSWTHSLYDLPQLKIAGNALFDTSCALKKSIVPADDISYLLGSSTKRYNAAYIGGLCKVGWITCEGTGDIVLSSLAVAQNLHGCHPKTADTYDLGQEGLEWDDLWAKTEHIGDIEFENKLRIIEAEYIGLKKGLAFTDSEGNLLMHLDEEGNLKVKGTVGKLGKSEVEVASKLMQTRIKQEHRKQRYKQLTK